MFVAGRRDGVLGQMGLNSWAPGTREHFIKIPLTIVNGDRVTRDGARQTHAEQA